MSEITEPKYTAAVGGSPLEAVVMRTDTERLDWLEENHESLYRVTQTVRVPVTTGSELPYRHEEQFLGWSIGSRTDECATVREAIDAAMNA